MTSSLASVAICLGVNGLQELPLARPRAVNRVDVATVVRLRST
jgi:hypothetical protein